jgi:hypothetical protein
VCRLIRIRIGDGRLSKPPLAFEIGAHLLVGSEGLSSPADILRGLQPRDVV